SYLCESCGMGKRSTMSIFRADKCQKWQHAFLVISISTSSNQSNPVCERPARTELTVCDCATTSYATRAAAAMFHCATLPLFCSVLSLDPILRFPGPFRNRHVEGRRPSEVKCRGTSPLLCARVKV